MNYEEPGLKRKESINVGLYDMWGVEGVRGLTVYNEKEYRIMIDKDITPAEQLAAFLHEITHVWRHDFDKTDVQQIECEVRRDLLEALEIVKAECLDSGLIDEEGIA